MPIARYHRLRFALVAAATLALGPQLVAQEHRTGTGADSVPVDAGSIVVLDIFRDATPAPSVAAPAVTPPPSVTAAGPDLQLVLRREAGSIIMTGIAPEDADFSSLTDVDVSGIEGIAGKTIRFGADLAFATDLVRLLAEGRVSLRANVMTIEGRAADPVDLARIEALLADPPPGLVLAMTRVDMIAIEPEADPAVSPAPSEPDTPEVIVVPAPEPSTTCREILAEFSARNSILFNSGSAVISPDSGAALAELAADVAVCGDVPIYIEGHTDSDGDAEANMVLSVSRAEAVVDALIELGVDPARLYAIGYGETDPLADNATPEGKRQNRRIVILAEDRFGSSR